MNQTTKNNTGVALPKSQATQQENRVAKIFYTYLVNPIKATIGFMDKKASGYFGYAMILLSLLIRTAAMAGYSTPAGGINWQAITIAIPIEFSVYWYMHQFAGHLSSNRDSDWKIKYRSYHFGGLLITMAMSCFFSFSYVVKYGRNFDAMLTGVWWLDYFTTGLYMVVLGFFPAFLGVFYAGVLGGMESSESPTQPANSALQVTIEELQAAIAKQQKAIGEMATEIEHLRDTLIYKCKWCKMEGSQNKINGHISHCEDNPKNKNKDKSKSKNGKAK
jgi:hypothetical protein